MIKQYIKSENILLALEGEKKLLFSFTCVNSGIKEESSRMLVQPPFKNLSVLRSVS